MTETIYIIVDVSGSMNEMGKIHLQRNLCRTISQLQLINQEKYSGLEFPFYQWAQNVSEVALQADEDIPALTAEGSSNLAVLSDFLSVHLDDAENSKVVILSDGNFEQDDYQQFLAWKNRQETILIRTIAVGADADLLKLKKISSNNTVYLAENIGSAIDGTIFDSDEPLRAPEFTNQILQSETIETEEPEDDWDA